MGCAAGLKVYGLIGAEAVNADPGNQFRNPPVEPVDNQWIRTYAQNFRKIVRLFGKDIAVVESFNEPNDWHRVPGDPTEWQQAWVDPGWFAIMLQAVYEAARDLDVTLVSGPLLSTADGNSGANYLPLVYEAGRSRFGWGQGAILYLSPAWASTHMSCVTPLTRKPISTEYGDISPSSDAIVRNDEPGKPIFLSEIGWQNAEDRQAACMAAGLASPWDDPSVALCIWYGMQDDDAEPYGLYREDGLTLTTQAHLQPICCVADQPTTRSAAQMPVRVRSAVSRRT